MKNWKKQIVLWLTFVCLMISCAAAEDIAGEFNVMLTSGAELDEPSGIAVWTPSGSDVGHPFGYQLTYEIVIPAGGRIGAGELSFTLPASILTNRYGEMASKYEMSIPTLEEANAQPQSIDAEVFLAYEEVDGSIVISNFREMVSGNYTGYIQMAYYSTRPSYEYRDHDPSQPPVAFEAAMRYPKMNGETAVHEIEMTPIVVDTQLKVSSVSKGYPTIHKMWNSDWGREPSDSYAYWYLAWPLTTQISDGTTQPYHITIEDIPGNVVDENGTVICEQEVCAYGLSGKDFVLTDGAITAQDQTLTLRRFDMVITRIPNIVVQQYVQWTADNTVNVTVESVDDPDEVYTMQDSSAYTYHKSVFWDPEGQFDAWKRADGAYRHYGVEIYSGTDGGGLFKETGMSAAENSRYDLNEFINGNLDVYDGFDYAVWAWGSAYLFTRDHAGWAEIQKNKQPGEDYTAIEMEEVYGRYPVKYEVVDGFRDGETLVQLYVVDENMQEGNGLPLTYEDFEFTSLQYNVEIHDGYFDEDGQSFVRYPISKLPSSQDVLTFYAMIGDSQEFELIARVSLGSNPLVEICMDGVSVDTEARIVTLPPNTVAFKLETENTYYDFSVGVAANLALKKTDRVLEYIGDADQIAIGNTMCGRLYRIDQETNEYTQAFESEWECDYTYARTSQREAQLTKRVVSGHNDVKNRRYVVSWCVEQKEIVRSGDDGKTSSLIQNGGVFYDLLPLGASLDESSVSVRVGSKYLPRDYYTIRQHANFRDHRTLVVITIADPGDSYTVTFDTLHPWDVIKDVGTSADNVVAYQTGNADISGGYPDNGAGLGPERAYLLDDLVEDNGERRFLYAQASTDVSSVTSASTGLSKHVKAVEDERYDDETFVYAGGDYIYRLRFAADPGVSYTNMIIFDEIEEDIKDNAASDWYGTLADVDVSALEMMGVDAKVYSSERTGVLPSEAETDYVFDPAVWTPVDGMQIPPETKCIAIDMRKDVNGGEFVLEEGEAVFINLFMYAPDKLPDNAANQNTFPQTYNGVSFIGTRTASDTGESLNELRRIGSTTVEYIVCADVPIAKRSSEDSTKAIRGVTFRLYGTSDYGTAVDMMQTTDSRGNTVFHDVEKGTYTILEYETTPDWRLDTTQHTIVIDKSGNLTVDGKAYEEGVYYTWYNAPRIHDDLVFVKKARAVGNYAETGIPGITFRLSGTSDYGTKIEMYATSDASGTVRFDDLELGSDYVLEELSGDWGRDSVYLPLGTTLRVRVTANGQALIDTTGVENIVQADEKGTGFTVWNERRFLSFMFYKRAEGTGEFLPGAQFTLTGNADSGTYYEMTAVSDSEGRVLFDGVERGVYVLRETKAPSKDGVNYQIDPKDYYVAIASNGTVTIDGMAFDDTLKGYVMTNEPANDNELVIYKKWVDYTADGRQPPELIVWTGADIPIGLGCSVTYDANGGSFDGVYSRNTVRYMSGEGGMKVSGEYKLPAYPVFVDDSGSPTSMQFEGWYTDLTYAKRFDPETDTAALSGNMTVYAKWSLTVDYAYTGDVQLFTAPVSGYYRMEAWGAMGADGYADARRKGTTGSRAGFGGYSTGTIYLSQGDKLFVFVGERGHDYNRSYNGGGGASSNPSWIGGGGGGMTHISTRNNPVPPTPQTPWAPEGTLLVGGGGGGADNACNSTRNKGIGDEGGGGDGGGLVGQDALIDGRYSSVRNMVTGGGMPGNTWQVQGHGQDFGGPNDDGAGGAGWYGGGSTGNNNGGGGGGSGYVDASLYDGATLGYEDGYPKVDGSGMTQKDDSFNGAPFHGHARFTYLPVYEPNP